MSQFFQKLFELNHVISSMHERADLISISVSPAAEREIMRAAFEEYGQPTLGPIGVEKGKITRIFDIEVRIE